MLSAAPVSNAWICRSSIELPTADKYCPIRLSLTTVDISEKREILNIFHLFRQYCGLVECTRRCPHVRGPSGKPLLRLDSSHLLVPLPITPRKFVMGQTSSTLRGSSSSTSPFQLIFERALQEYKKKTGKDLATHPLAAEINGCASPDAILAILEAKARELDESQSGDERLTKWLDPTVNILNALSATLGQGVSTVSWSFCARYMSVPQTLLSSYSPLLQSSLLALVSFS